MLKTSLRLVSGVIKFLRRSAAIIAIVLILAIAALFLTMRYSVLPDIERFHNDITSSVSKAIGLGIEIGKIEADWHGIGPHLRLSDIRILDKQSRTTLALQHVDVVVSWMTLLTGEVRLASLEIDQPDLMVKRDAQGVLQISGVTLGGKSSDNDFSDMLLHQSRIVVRGAHISWLDEKQSKPLLVFDKVNLLIENRWNFHRFAMSAMPPAELSSQLDVRGDFYGSSFDDMQSWSGEIFTQLDYADLPAWKTWLPLPNVLKQGKGALRGWLGIEDGKIDRITTDLALVDVQTRLAEDLPLLDINVLSGRLGWKFAEKGFEISTRNLSFKLFNNFVLHPTDLFLKISNIQDIQSSSGEARANLIELDGLGKLMEFLPLGSNIKEQYAKFLPLGKISNLQAKWQAEPGEPLRYKVKARFVGLSLQRVDKLPGFSGLSGEVDGTESSGSLSLNSHNLTVDSPQYMPEPLAFDTLLAQSNWKKYKGGFELSLRNFSMANSDLAGTAYGSFRTQENTPGNLDINVHLTRALVPHASKYIPLIALGEKARGWVNKALQSGTSNDFNIRLKGNLNEFPFVDNRNGIFYVHGRAKGVALEYVDGWPRIENANANFLLQGKQMEVVASSGTTAGLNLKNVKVTIPDILHHDLLLSIKGQADTSNVSALEFIHTSPVRRYLGGLTDSVKAKGNGKLDLELNVPLSDPKSTRVAGVYHLIDSEIEIDKKLPTFRKVNGDLKFRESGLNAESVTAQVLGGPAKLDVSSSDGGAMSIKLNGKANFDVLHQLNPSPILKKLSGEPLWSVDIGVANKQTKVLITSTLHDFRSELPAPLSKHGNEPTPLRVELNHSSPTQIFTALQYGSLLNANLLQTKDIEGVWQLKRGIVNFGNVPQKADRDGLWVIGTIPNISLDNWPDMASLSNANDDEESVPINLAGVDLVVQKLTGYGNTVNDFHIKANSRHGKLIAQLASKEINGDLTWQSEDNGRLVARLKNLDITLPDANSANKKDANTELHNASDDSTELPELDVIIDTFNFKGRPVGKLEMLAKQDGQIYLLDHLRLSNPDGVLTLDGKWMMSASTPKTEVNVKSEILNAGNVLARSGFPNSIKNGKGNLEASFTWMGTPVQFAKESLNGKLSLDMGKGQFLQIDPGIGKLLSILSLQALPKHITLDFEDVFSKGFEFDSIKGSADIKQGVLVTDNLKIDGSSAKVFMRGQIDLINESQNLRIRVVPAVGNSAALLSWLVATPVVGAGVYLAGKILNDPLGQLASFEYNVSGSWIDPKVEKVGEKKPAN